MWPLEQIRRNLAGQDHRILEEAEDGMCGYILWVEGYLNYRMRFIASWGGGWEHVSVSGARSCPPWEAMCFVKDLFWKPEEEVMQLHPPKSQYINNHPYCLHLWRPIAAVIPLPPKIMVGV